MTNSTQEIWDDFVTTIKQTLDFNGRTRRRVFWRYVLVLMLFLYAASFWDMILPGDEYLRNVIRSAFFLTTLSAVVRRLHDSGRSGWWTLLSFTGIGNILLLIWCAQDSDINDNEYGDSPKYSLADLDEDLETILEDDDELMF